MAFSTPSTVVAGNVLTASYLNTYVRDNIAWMATDSPACRAYRSTSQSLGTSGTEAAIAMDSERYDNSAIHDTSSNTTRFTIPTGAGGKFLFGSTVEFASNSTGYRAVAFKINATTYCGINNMNAVATAVTQVNSTTAYALAAADYLETYCTQTSGGALNIASSSAYSPEMWMFWIRT